MPNKDKNTELKNDDNSDDLAVEAEPSPATGADIISSPLTPDDILAMRLPENELEAASAKIVRTEIVVNKPAKDQFFRVHDSAEYWGSFGLLETPTTGEKYLVRPGEVMNWLVSQNENCFIRANLCLAVTYHGAPYLWPLKISDNRWSESAREIAELAKTKWTMLQSDRQAGYYVGRIAASQDKAPQWPDENFGELLLKGFRNRVIDSMDHEAVKLLRGEV